MTLLALYWSIMIACYLLGSCAAKGRRKIQIRGQAHALSVYALVLLMGLRMGADEEVTSSLGSIGIQALFVTVLTAAGSMLGAFAVRKLLHIDRHSHPAGAVVTKRRRARKGRRLGRENVFYHLADGRCGMLSGILSSAACAPTDPPFSPAPAPSCSRSLYHAGARRLLHGT